MGDSISRRDFIKQTSVVGLAAAANPVTALAAPAAPTRVVIATDPLSVTSTGVAVPAKIQDMVDHAIMALTGKTAKGAAYEALFPAAVTTATKILLKRNDVSGTGAVNTAVVNAFKTGLTSMLNGTFPAANVTIRNAGGSVKTQITATTYLINCPVCWCHGSDYGVTLSLKNTMTYLNSAGVYHSANKSWLHTVSLDPAIKPKQVLSLLDAVVGNNQSGPGSGATFRAGTIIVGKDLVAVDYHALRLMAKQPSANTAQITIGDNQLKAAQTAGLGTCTPANMEVINIAPPWTTGIISDPATGRPGLDMQISNKGNTIEFSVPRQVSEPVTLTIFDMMGKTVRHIPNTLDQNISWNTMAQNGSAVPAGMYAFTVQTRTSKARGVVMVTR